MPKKNILIVNNSGVSIAYFNPYRYRSYYYDANVGRFVNGDDIIFLGASGTNLGYNLYTYCENNIINMIDFNGRKPEELFNSIEAAANKYNISMFVATPFGNLLKYDPRDYSTYTYTIKIPTK